MAEKSIVASAKRYLNELIKHGIPVRYGILFGSHARKEIHRWSDIDLLIISSKYDEAYNREDINILWRIAAVMDNRIEPVPVGLKRWEVDDESPILEIARREGIQITI